MPAVPPSVGSGWSVVPAFPNLTFINAVGICQMPGANRMVVWEREGRAYSFEKSTSAATRTLLLDVSARCQGWDDSGLLGLAFHPRFSLGGEPGTNRYVFVWYTFTDRAIIGGRESRPPTYTPVRDRLSRFTLDANGVAIPESETVFIDQYSQSVFHNGGGMFFHPGNGFLYITNGDDASDTAQRIDGGLFSGVLRIDVDQRGGSISHPPTRMPVNAVTAHYYIPNDNPFVGLPQANEEFFAIGLRSPHRMTIDPQTGRIFIGDVGGGAKEEINVIGPNDPPGLNFQWPWIEGINGDLQPPHLGVNKRPLLDYGRGDGAAVIGGYVYRGREFAGELGGKYIFGDNMSRTIWVLNETTSPPQKIALCSFPDGPGPVTGGNYAGLSSFGVDAEQELYLCQMGADGGKIYKLQRGGAPSQPLPALLSQTGVFSDLAGQIPSEQLIPYGLIQPFWSDGAAKRRWAAIPSGTNVGFAPTGEWTWPTGTVMVKHFDLPISDLNPALTRPLETRLLVKMDGGGAYGATYRWRADRSDAELVESAVTENVPIAIAPLGTITGSDIGSPNLAGSTTRNGDVVVIEAGGSDIWSSADQFHFAAQQRTGDFDVAVRVESLTAPDLNTKAGLMVRETLAPGSRNVMALVYPTNANRGQNTGGYELQYRALAGGATQAAAPAQPAPRVNYPNTWLRLQRAGDQFIAFHSVDGVWWTEYARQTLDLPSNVYFGLAATARTNGNRAVARMHLQSVRFQPWYYPGRGDCLACHTSAAGGILGPKTRQLNGAFTYGKGVTENQLLAWAQAGIFDHPPLPAEVAALPKLAALNDGAAPLEQRARSYLDANCANCHRPGATPALWDARYDTPLAQQGLLYGATLDNLGNPSARVIVPQDLDRSILHRRIHTVGATQMPPLARNQIDFAGADLLAQWILGLPANPAPAIVLATPFDGAHFIDGTDISITANASDADGIRKVEFYNGGTKIGEDETAPFTLAWSNPPRGVHTISAAAIDQIGNLARSNIATITVQGPPLPSPWKHRDIGTVLIPGDSTYASGAFTVTASGSDIWGSADQFHFAYRTLTGDGELVARVAALQNTDSWAKCGVMIRETLHPGARHAATFITPENGAGFQSRAQPVGPTSYSGGWSAAKPYWLRIARRGDVCISSISPDGVAWTEIGSRHMPMTATVYVGLALTSHNAAVAGSAVFDSLRYRTATPAFVEDSGQSFGIAPSVAVTSPPNAAQYNNAAQIRLQASASDPDSSVAKVEFYVNGAKVGEDLAPPYEFTWAGVTYGTHAIIARATDATGRVTDSEPVQFTANLAGAAGFRGEYFTDTSWNDLAMVRLDPTIDATFHGSPDLRLSDEMFAVRWTGRVTAKVSGPTTFTTYTDDGARLWVDGALVIDQWVNQSPTRHSTVVNLVAGQTYEVLMEYFENGGGAMARLLWSAPGLPEEAIPASHVVPPPTAPNSPPEIQLLLPAMGSRVLASDPILFAAAAQDGDGLVERVEFWHGGTLLGQDVSAPFTWNWPAPHAPGNLAVKAVAIDNLGARTESAPAVVASSSLALVPAQVQRLPGSGQITATLRTTLPPGRSYVVEWSGDLEVWEELRRDVSDGGEIVVTDTAAAPESGKRFYRLRVLE